MGTILIDALGYLAAATVLATFSVRSIKTLRALAIISNLLFIAYAACANLSPVLALHALLLPLNMWRLREMLVSNRDVNGEAVDQQIYKLNPLNNDRRRHATRRTHRDQSTFQIPPL
jgi:hypothetical protein